MVPQVLLAITIVTLWLLVAMGHCDHRPTTHPLATDSPLAPQAPRVPGAWLVGGWSEGSQGGTRVRVGKRLRRRGRRRKGKGKKGRGKMNEFTLLPFSVSTSSATAPRWHSAHEGPLLDMSLFDWTEYEDMRPRGWMEGGIESDGWCNTSIAGDAQSCHHHPDCDPGSCCDLRHQLCHQHHLDKNARCYGDCMCNKGLRCFAKFHQRSRVTRTKGRCQDPSLTNPKRGSFITS
uniref:Draxin n=1 Tax=Eptatretus burgeri TaxID=7764 RepID=A0A8C4QLL5_EPTBU